MQDRLSIIIPTLNDENNICRLVERIDLVLKRCDIGYEIIFIDNHSSDNTRISIEKLFFLYPVFFYPIKGKKGESQSLIEGLNYVKYDFIALMDANMQCPPESLPVILKKIKEGCDISVSDDVKKQGLFEHLFQRQYRNKRANIMIFRKSVAEKVIAKCSREDSYMEFLFIAQKCGFNIGRSSGAFLDEAPPKKGFISRVSGLKKFHNVEKKKFKEKSLFLIVPKNETSMAGAGITLANKRYITHTTLTHDFLAVRTFVSWQKYFIIFAAFTFIYELIINPFGAGIALIGFLSAIYFFDMIFNLYLVAKSLKNPPEIKSDHLEISSLPDNDLPVYSILCPLYKEAHMLPVFLAAIDKLDWPKRKLDVLLLLEEDDTKTIDAAKAMHPPFYVRILIVPDSLPKTKPKACNYGISFAKGEYLVIYDAEDIPDPFQLKKAYLGFKKMPESVGCLQAKLNYFNPYDNLLTKLFTAEYSLWFDIVLPGLQSINTSIPLGGTSNHFRTKDLLALEGWDPFNVTEDCDLGIRIFQRGYKTAIIDSVTFEEANSDVKNWLRQRSRWIKGYIQTYLVHMRHPIDFFKKNGIHALIFQLIIGGKTAFIIINPILWLSTVSYFTLHSVVGPTIEMLYPPVVFYIAASSFVFGNFLAVYYYMIGCAKRDQWPLVKYVFFIPFYWALMSAASLIAVSQLVVKPHFWEKTNHGLALKKAPEKEKAVSVKKPISENNENVDFVPKRLIPKGVLFASKNGWVGALRSIGEKAFLVLFGFCSFLKKSIIFTAGVFTGFFEAFGSEEVINDKNFESGAKKILIFNWRDTRHKLAGGAEAYVQEIAKNWVADGCKVTIFCGSDSMSPKKEIVEGVEIIRRGGFYSVYIWAFLYYMLRFRGAYDIIIDCQNGIPFFTPLYAEEPVYCLMHHVHQEVFRISLPKSLALFAAVLEKNFMPLVYRNTPFVTVSESSKQGIKSLGMGQKEICIVCPGADTDNMVPCNKSYNPLVLYLGRLKAYKSIEVLLKAFSILSRIDPRAVLVVAGGGEELDKLKKLAKNLNRGKQRVYFKGKISEEKKIKLLQKAWVLVNPSLMEGWGMVIIEACACGTPAVASDVPGLRDSVKNGQTGYLVPYGDSAAMAERILKIIQDKELRYRLGYNARLWAENFSWRKSSDLLFKIIDSGESKKMDGKLAYYKNN